MAIVLSIESVDWYIVYDDGDGPHWWHRFLKPGFRHVYAMRWDGYNWIRIDPALQLTTVNILPQSDQADLAELVHKSPAVLQYCKIKLDTSKRYRAPWILVPATCVEQVKTLLGISAPWVLTPRQLYRYLRRYTHVERCIQTGSE